MTDSVSACASATESASRSATLSTISRCVVWSVAWEGFARRRASLFRSRARWYSSTVLEALERAAEEGISLTVYCAEARPRHLGRKMARTLAAFEAFDVHLIVDGAAGIFLPECDRVLVGMDCIVDDTLYNRVGTYPVAATAADVGVPVVVVGAESKIVGGGFAFENEERSVAEVIREPADGFVVENPAYDATPMRLVDRVVTDAGVHEN